MANNDKFEILKDQALYARIMDGSITAIEGMDIYLKEGKDIYFLEEDGFSTNEERNIMMRDFPARILLRDFFERGLKPDYFDEGKESFFFLGEAIQNACRKTGKNKGLFSSGIITSDGMFYPQGATFHEHLKEWLRLNGVDVRNSVSVKKYSICERAEVKGKPFISMCSAENVSAKNEDRLVELSREQIIALYNICYLFNCRIEDCLITNNSFGFRPDMGIQNCTDHEILQIIKRSDRAASHNIKMLQETLGDKFDISGVMRKETPRL